MPQGGNCGGKAKSPKDVESWQVVSMLYFLYSYVLLYMCSLNEDIFINQRETMCFRFKTSIHILRTILFSLPTCSFILTCDVCPWLMLQLFLPENQDIIINKPFLTKQIDTSKACQISQQAIEQVY